MANNKKKTYTKRLNLWITAKTKRIAKQQAARDGVDLGELARTALEVYLSERADDSKASTLKAASNG